MMFKLSVKRDELEINLEAKELNIQELRGVMGGVLEVLKVSKNSNSDVPFDFDAVVKKFGPNMGESNE